MIGQSGLLGLGSPVADFLIGAQQSGFDESLEFQRISSVRKLRAYIHREVCPSDSRRAGDGSMCVQSVEMGLAATNYTVLWSGIYRLFFRLLQLSQ